MKGLLSDLERVWYNYHNYYIWISISFTNSRLNFIIFTALESVKRALQFEEL